MPHPNGKYVQIFRSMDRVRRAWQNVAPCEGVSKSEFFTLLTLAHGDCPPPPAEEFPPAPQAGVTLSALAAMMNQSLPAISQRISALEAAGYVQRAAGSDRRVSTVCLTQEGNALLQKAYGNMRQTLDKALECMTEDECTTLVSLIGRLADAFEALTKQEASEMKKENMS